MVVSFYPRSASSISGIKLIQNQWSLDRVLSSKHQISQSYFHNAPLGLTDNFCRLLSRDVYSEGDAQILYDYLLARQDELSNDFILMLELWLEDEQKHYEALRRTYHCVAGVSYKEMDTQFRQRAHDLKPIETLLQDELAILVTLMFDEIGSVYSYRRDLSEYYCYFGLPIKQIAHHLVKDEGSHFSNAAELILLHHSPRLPEVP